MHTFNEYSQCDRCCSEAELLNRKLEEQRFYISNDILMQKLACIFFFHLPNNTHFCKC